MTPLAVLKVSGLRRFRTGHPWIYRDDVDSVEGSNGDLVEVQDPGRHAIGHAFFSAQSRIALRLVSWGEGDLPDPGSFFAGRIAAAVRRREPLLETTDAMRLVSSEADGLPGLVVDRYAGVLCVSTLVPATERNLDRIVPPLVDLLSPAMVLARNDAAVRTLEGLPREVRLLHGSRVESVRIRDGDVSHGVDPFKGQKTGFFLDQRNARRRVRELAGALGGRMLDLCSYTGGFALAALKGGAASALAVDTSGPALEQARRDAAANGLQGLEVLDANVFEASRTLVAAGERFDLVVLDPPAFAKSRREVSGGVRGYLDLNRRAMELLAPGGRLLTCSCSHHVAPHLFLDILREACARTGRRAFFRERLPPGLDHPVLATLPESEYLKAYLLEMAD